MTAYQPSSAPQRARTSATPDAAVGAPGPGLTVLGVLVVVGVPTLVVALVETAWHSRLSWLFGITFAVASLFAASRIRVSAVVAGAIVPPLAFLAALVASHPLLSGGEHGLKGLALDIGTALATGAPYLVPVSVTCAVITLVRRRRR